MLVDCTETHIKLYNIELSIRLEKNKLKHTGTKHFLYIETKKSYILSSSL